MKITLCLLTFNELEGCRHDLPLLDRTGFDDIYAVDAGSTDGTQEYLKSQNIPVYIQPEKGLNAACAHAIEKCRTDAIVFFHPKGSVPPEDTLKFRKFFEAGCELVVASRNIKNARNEEDNRFLKPRKWFVLCLAYAATLLWRREGPAIYDVLHGFRGATLSAFKKMNPRRFGMTIDIEMVVRAYRLKLKRAEFPTRESPRLAGETHFKALPTGWKIIKYFAGEMFRVA